MGNLENNEWDYIALEINERSNHVITSAVKALRELDDLLAERGPEMDDEVRLRVAIASRLLDSGLFATIGAQDRYVGEVRAELDRLRAVREISKCWQKVLRRGLDEHAD